MQIANDKESFGLRINVSLISVKQYDPPLFTDIFSDTCCVSIETLFWGAVPSVGDDYPEQTQLGYLPKAREGTLHIVFIFWIIDTHLSSTSLHFPSHSVTAVLCLPFGNATLGVQQPDNPCRLTSPFSPTPIRHPSYYHIFLFQNFFFTGRENSIRFTTHHHLIPAQHDRHHHNGLGPGPVHAHLSASIGHGTTGISPKKPNPKCRSPKKGAPPSTTTMKPPWTPKTSAAATSTPSTLTRASSAV